MKVKPTLAAICALAIAALVSIVVFQRQDNAGGELPLKRTVYRPVDVNADRLFLMETLDDVGLHADAIVLGTPVAELELEDPEVVERGEGYLGRCITVRIDRVLWQKRAANVPVGEIQTAGGSWRYSEGTRTPFFYFGEIGQQYMLIFKQKTNREDADGYEWMHDGTLGLPIVDGRTPTVIESEKPFFAAVRGKTPDELVKVFATSLSGD